MYPCQHQFHHQENVLFGSLSLTFRAIRFSQDEDQLTLQTVSSFRLLSNDIKNSLDELGTLSVVCAEE